MDIKRYRRRPIMESIKDAKFSSDRRYRYTLTRIWNRNKPIIAFIGLNPSIADEINDDRTVTRCANFAKQEDYGGFIMVNLFSIVATFPEDMKNAKDPIGPKNNKYILEVAEKVDMIIACWGNDGLYLNRSEDVYNMLKDKKVMCFKRTQLGEPHHPRGLSKDIRPIPYNY